jgi:hypothetical protein
MTNTLPPPPLPTVYAHVLSFTKHRGKVTPETWYTALLELQQTPQAHASMRDVWDWEQAGCPTPEKQDPEQVALDACVCVRCGVSFVPSVSRQVYCTSQCRMANRSSRAKCTKNAFCANPECGVGFEQKNPKNTYCCGICNSRALYLRKKAARAQS